MIRIWGRRNSFNVQKVLWLVGELGIGFEHVPAGGSFGRLDEPEFRALNPHGHIPVIEDGAVAVCAPAIERSVQRCAQHYRLLDRLLAQQPFVAGAELSLADIPIGASLYRYFGMDVEHPSIPHVEAWYRRLQQRPAYREHVMVSFEDLRGRLDY